MTDHTWRRAGQSAKSSGPGGSTCSCRTIASGVPTHLDRRDLPRPAGVDISWVVRDDSNLVAGVKTLAALKEYPPLDPNGYGFVVGESKLATEGRRQLHRLGLPKDRITFSGFWKH